MRRSTLHPLIKKTPSGGTGSLSVSEPYGAATLGGAWGELTEDGNDNDEDGAKCHFGAFCEVFLQV